MLRIISSRSEHNLEGFGLTERAVGVFAESDVDWLLLLRFGVVNSIIISMRVCSLPYNYVTRVVTRGSAKGRRQQRRHTHAPSR